jgi:hypothetical protein
LDAEFWRLKRQLQTLPKKVLDEMLTVNGKYTNEGDFKPVKLAHHAADGALFGTAGACPACVVLGIWSARLCARIACWLAALLLGLNEATIRERTCRD